MGCGTVRKSITVNTYIRKEEKPKTKTLNFILQTLDKEEQIKYEESIKKAIIKVGTEINAIKNNNNRKNKPKTGTLRSIN